MEKKQFVIVDAYGFLFRAYYALPHLNTSYGRPIGGVYGFVNMLLRHLSSHRVDYLAVVFDSGSKNFRHSLYTQYKTNRPKVPEDLLKQFSPLREAVNALQIASEEVHNYEADDVIATLSKRYASEDIEVRILTADKDLLQLLGENIRVFDPIKNRYLTEEYVVDKFGVTPDKLQDVFALTGDSSDNVPGVPGIGIKTAAKLINQFGSLDNVLSCTEQVEGKKCREALAQNADKAILSRDLVSLCTEVSVDGDINKYETKQPAHDKLSRFLRKYELLSLSGRVERYYQISLGPLRRKRAETHTESSAEALEGFIVGCLDAGLMAISLDIDHDRSSVKSASISYDGENAFCVSESDMERFIDIALPILSSDSVLKVVHDAKSMMAHFPSLKAFDDIMLMSYCLDAGSQDHGLKSITHLHLREYLKDSMPPACALVRLHAVMKQKLFEEKLCTIYYRLERPLTRVLHDIQRAGIEIDVGMLQRLSDRFDGFMGSLAGEIYALAGKKFNISSSKQLGSLLFDEMQCKGAKKTPSGSYCTNAEVLTELSAEGVEIADKVLNWRHFAKLKHTYTDAMLKQIATGTRRIHTHYSMVSTATGRITSSNPNLQSIPVRSKEGGEIRKAFVAKQGYKLVSADYSQMELKVMAHIADVKAFKDAFSKNEDIHLVTAEQIFGKSGADPEFRRRAKSINFGIIYGISPFGLARNIGLSTQEASEYVEEYFRLYPEISDYMEAAKAYARKHGYTRTVWGRKCFISGINSKQHAARGFAERAAINAPIQGTAADIVKKAMTALHSRLDAGYMVLQVHDEILFEIPDNQIEQSVAVIKETMEGVVNFSVPLSVDVGVACSWGDIVKKSADT